MHHMRRRSGQILFLEYTTFLPIFAMFFLFSMSFHIWYWHTREAFAYAQFSANRAMDRHWIRDAGRRQADDGIINGLSENGGRLEDRRIVDGIASQGPLEINHISKLRSGTVSLRNVRLPNLGQGTPTGIGFNGRDSWSHRDIVDQMETQVFEAQPFILYQPTAGGNLPTQFLRL